MAWSGDVSATEYIQAEANATRAGRKLVNLLLQLRQEGIRVNIIAHSLGNRVLLTLLNLLADRGLNNVVDTAFLWQPAIPDTALSSDPRQDTSVLRNWHFSQAHRAARTLVVLHSAQDNVLGGHTSAQAGLQTPGCLYRVGRVHRGQAGQWGLHRRRPPGHSLQPPVCTLGAPEIVRPLGAQHHRGQLSTGDLNYQCPRNCPCTSGPH